MAGARLRAPEWQTSIDARPINVMVMYRRCHTVRDRIISEQGIEIFQARTAFLRSQMSDGTAIATATRVENSVTLDEILERWQMIAESQRDFNGMNSWLS